MNLMKRKTVLKTGNIKSIPLNKIGRYDLHFRAAYHISYQMK